MIVMFFGVIVCFWARVFDTQETARPHDDRKGHHYYTTPFACISCMIVMFFAVIVCFRARVFDTQENATIILMPISTLSWPIT